MAVLGHDGSHPRDLLVSFVPILLIGFLSVALPRWTRHAIAPPGVLEVLLVCHALALLLTWCAPRASLFLQVIATIAASAVFVRHAIVARVRGTAYVVALVGIQAITGSLVPYASHLGPVFTRICLSAIILLCLELGGRIAFALVSAAFEREGLVPPAPVRSGLVLAHRVFAAGALALWSLDIPFCILAFVAGFVGFKRLILLRPWGIRPIAGILAGLAGVAWMNLGFVGLGIVQAEIYPIPDLAIIHVWSVGGLGTIAIAVMTSVTRKRDQMSFQPSSLTNTSYALIAMTAIVRISAAMIMASPVFLFAARLGWIAAFSCCLTFIVSGLWGNNRTRISWS
ncbi:NnrS family protein [Microvirga sp. VF16]|uniref:NnrS family protein n=1 Tax=Microvirga sp. VF16 TaxID=2807101 RepID=UPI001FEE52B0|nr:NnrS family protein [Microvirga sp. VF16]